MAKIKTGGALVDDVIGNFKTGIIQPNSRTGIKILRSKYVDKKESVEQAKQRRAFFTTDAYWSVMNETQRMGWHVNKPDHRFSNYSFFMAVNVPRIVRGDPPIIDKPYDQRIERTLQERLSESSLPNCRHRFRKNSPVIIHDIESDGD
jgi:hypothetical protein